MGLLPELGGWRALGVHGPGEGGAALGWAGARVSYFHRHDLPFADLPWLYVAHCDCGQNLFVPMSARQLNAHQAPWCFERIYGWRIEDNRITCPVCVAREAVGWKMTSWSN